MKKFLSLITALTLGVQAEAQHFYYKLDVGTSNIYSFAVANLATAGLNTLVDGMLFDNAYTYTYLQTSNNTYGIETKNYDIVGITARDIFSDITAGGKIGYQSFNPSNFNWGIFGSAHYRVNQFKTTIQGIDETFHNDVQRLLLGGGLMFTFGSLESSTRFIIEAGLRYEMPLRYNRADGQKVSDIINSGLSSHYAIRINGNGALQGLGVYADISHYDLFKNTEYLLNVPNIKMFTFGLIYTITPWKVKSLY